jgi:hypothetical protein
VSAGHRHGRRRPCRRSSRPSAAPSPRPSHCFPAGEFWYPIGTRPRRRPPSSGDRASWKAQKRLGEHVVRSSVASTATTTGTPRVSVPIGVPELQRQSGKTRDRRRRGEGGRCPICRDKAGGTDDHGLLAMQKVEGSSPFSRVLEAPGLSGRQIAPADVVHRLRDCRHLADVEGLPAPFARAVSSGAGRAGAPTTATLMLFGCGLWWAPRMQAATRSRRRSGLASRRASRAWALCCALSLISRPSRARVRTCGRASVAW